MLKPARFTFSRFSLRSFNNYLSALVILVAGYLLVGPFLPKIAYTVTGSSQKNELTNLIASTDQTTFPTDNRLVVPSALVNEPILDGPTESTVHKGAWRRPNSATPDRGGNTVIAGHRYSYRSDTRFVFYNLDKVQVGDSIAVFWQAKKYDYQVREVRIVTPDSIGIEANTENTQLTLYTCAPLWTSQYRLVVIADLVGETEALR